MVDQLGDKFDESEEGKALIREIEEAERQSASRTPNV